jgi:3-deoxy-D-manno-octulosonate 8-phosphate phosphatase (KDO 8-P phosphatase)
VSLTAKAFDKVARRIKLLVFDVDGVLTDGGLYYGADGEVLKRFNVKDGHALVMARLTGLPSAVLTARTSKIVAVRGEELKLAAVLQGQKYKAPGLRTLAASLSLKPEECAYMGDDTNDLPPMELAGLSACPADGDMEVRKVADFVSKHTGGHGAARDFVERVLKAQGRWQQALDAMRNA